MSLAHDPHRLYEFLPPSTRQASQDGVQESLVPRIIDGMQDLTDVAITKEAPVNASAWQARLHIDGECRTANPEKIADNYLAYLGFTGIRDVRLFELDRPLPPSPSRASNIRLSVTAEPGAQRQQYNYELTLYTPSPDAHPGQQDEFDEELYAQLTAEGRLGPREAERAIIAAQMKRAAADPARTTPAPLPEITRSGIYSQFAFSLLSGADGTEPRIYTRTFGSKPEGVAPRSTPIDSPHNQIDAAYDLDLQRLTPLQRMLLENRGGHAVAHFDLSLTLRHLAGDKLQYAQQR